MSLSMFRQRGDSPLAASSTAPPSVMHSSYLGPDCELCGRLHFDTDARIDGRVEGAVEAERSLIVGASASVYAHIDTGSVIVSGHVEGNIVAKHHITIAKNAHVIGDLETRGIVIEEGARIEGTIVIREPEAETRPLAVAAH